MMTLRELMEAGDPYSTHEIAAITGRPFLSVASQLNTLAKRGQVVRCGTIRNGHRPLTIWKWVAK